MQKFSHHVVRINNKDLSFKIAGNGQPIVLFHSLLADQSSWELVAPELAKTHQVIQLSLPGFDASDFVGGALDDIANHIGMSLESLQLSQKPILMGNGYGGFVALNTALKFPNLPAKLVLADCGACFSEPGRAAFRGMSENTKNKGLVAIADVAMRRLFAPEYQAKHPQLIEERKERFLNIHLDTFYGACEALSTMDLRPQVKNLQLPALVVVGEFDEATPVPMSEELAQLLPQSELKILSGLAHVPQLQDPQAFMNAIQHFI
jgi:3-oxoadipate enol-lactonase